MSLKRKMSSHLFRRSTVYFFIFFSALAVQVDAGNAQEEFPWEMFIPAIIQSTSGLSPAQAAFIREIGYPQQFTKTFSYQGGRKRVDEFWVYSQHRVLETFINGVFVNESLLSGTHVHAPPSRCRPQYFQHDTTTQNIISRYGQPAKIKQATIWNGVLKTYVYPFMYLRFIRLERTFE